MENKDYQICTKCILESTGPEIYFDRYGVFHHYIKGELFQKKNSWFLGLP